MARFTQYNSITLPFALLLCAICSAMLRQQIWSEARSKLFRLWCRGGYFFRACRDGVLSPTVTPSGVCRTRHPVVSARSDECQEAMELVTTPFDQSDSEVSAPSAREFSQSTKGFRPAVDWGRLYHGIRCSQLEGMLSVPGIFNRIRLFPCTSNGDERRPSSDRVSQMKSGYDAVIRAGRRHVAATRQLNGQG
jgi:hypothetical protein